MLTRDGARAELRETEDRRSGGKVLRIRVTGPPLGRRNLLAVLRHEIASTHRRTFDGLVARERVPCNCAHCAASAEPRMYDYADLAKSVQAGRGELYCPDGAVDVPIIGMLDGVVAAGDSGARDLLDPEAAKEMIERAVGPAARRAAVEPRKTARSLAHRLLFNSDLRLPADPMLALAVAARLMVDRPPVQVTVPVQVNAQQANQQTTSVDIDIQQKNDLCFELSGLLDNLREDVAGQDAAEVARLRAELDKAQAALEQLASAQDPRARANRGLLTRLKGVVEKIADTESALGKLVKSAQGGAETARRAVGLYNKLAPLFGGVPVPNSFK